MRNWLAAIGIFCASGAWGASGHGHMGNWYECKQVSDCVLVPAICGGPASVNRAFKDKYEKWAISQAAEVGCKRSKDLGRGVRSVCEKGYCSAKHPPAPAPKKTPEKK